MRTKLIATRLCAGVVLAASLASAPRLTAQTVNASVNVDQTLAVFPDYGMGIHTSVYDNSLQYNGSSVFNQLDGLLDNAGVNVLRYPGGGYADVFHFSLSRPGGLTGNGLTPWWGEPTNYGYMGPKTDFGSFVKLLDATGSNAVITVNTGGPIKFAGANQLGVPTHAGQPQEAAAWVAYANGDSTSYGTPQDVALGVDAEGNDWKTAGYWARLRASTSAEYAAWAGADGVYDARNAFLAIDRDAPAGIEYWEIGNETFGTAYYGGGPGNRGYALNYAAPYNGNDGTLRDDNPALSPAAYGQQVNAFTQAMKAVDPTIKVGAVLATPRTQASNPLGDYAWSYADLNDDGVKQPSEPYWNDEVLSQVTPGFGKVADAIDFVIAHWYPGGNATSILDEPRLTIPPMIHGTTPGLDTGSNAGLRDNIANHRSDGNANALEIFITETDGYGGTTQASDGKFAADAYITFFENGVSNVDWLELHSGNSFLSESANQPNFAYWGVESVHQLASPGDRLVATTTTNNLVRVHAAVQQDGSVGLMIINNNTTSRDVAVSIAGAALAADGVRFQTNGDQALAQANLSSLGNAFTTSVPARTIQVFVIPLADLSGDFTFDGQVDAADFLAWQRGESLDPLSEADLAQWTALFGGAATAVSEPTAATLALMLLLASRVPCPRPRGHVSSR